MSAEDIRSLETGVVSYLVWLLEFEPGSLEDYYMLLTIKSFFQPTILFLKPSTRIFSALCFIP